MAVLTKIRVTATDNELYILASTRDGSAEICHIKSGYNHPVVYEVDPATILQADVDYDLTMIGINWGGPQKFKVTLTLDGNESDYGDADPSDDAAVGAIWTKTVPVRVGAASMVS